MPGFNPLTQLENVWSIQLTLNTVEETKVILTWPINKRLGALTHALTFVWNSDPVPILSIAIISSYRTAANFQMSLKMSGTSLPNEGCYFQYWIDF